MFQIASHLVFTFCLKLAQFFVTVENIKYEISYFTLPRITSDTPWKWNCIQHPDSPVLPAGFNKQKVKETSKLSQNWLWEIVDFNKEKVQETSRISRKCRLLVQRYKAMALVWCSGFFRSSCIIYDEGDLTLPSNLWRGDRRRGQQVEPATGNSWK